MHQTTAGIDYPYLSVPSSPYLLHSSAKLLQPSDMNATVCYGLQQSKISHRARQDSTPSRTLQRRSSHAKMLPSLFVNGLHAIS